jgi:predicted dienelactone hydrolase
MSLKLRTFFPRFATRVASYASGVCLGLLLPFTLAQPAPAAEQVTLTYGFLEISTSVEALRNYAERGEVDEDLEPYLKFLTEEQRSQFRTALQTRQAISSVEISQFLYSSIGQNILRSMGDIIRTQGRRDGTVGLRSALVLAAEEPGGLSLLGVLDNFPTNTVRIDSQRIFQALDAFTGLINDTQRAIAAIEQQANALEDSGQAPTLPDLAQAGPYSVKSQTLTLTDPNRDRELTVDLYLPETAAGEAIASAPLVVASHGLTGTRKGFANIATHLTSHGFAVAALDHPGSDRNQLEALLRGTVDEVAEPTEFSDRPRDISYLLDELTRQNAANGPFANRFNLEQVGMIGHSFGGYTSLAIAGAKLNFETLQTNCNSNDFIFNAANTSMLLQCTALNAPEQFSAELRDPRILSVMAMNPVTSSLFGPEGFSQIAIPTLIVSGTADPITPALLEQIQPYLWLNQATNAQATSTPETPAPAHYLALIDGGSHLYGNPQNSPELENADEALTRGLISPDPALTDRYLKAMSLGFMQLTLTNDSQNRDVITQASILKVGEPTLPLYVVSALTEDMLMPAVVAPPAEGEPLPEPSETPLPDPAADATAIPNP